MFRAIGRPLISHTTSLLFTGQYHIKLIVSKSDNLGPNGNLSDIKNLVSFERETFEDFSYKYRIQKNPIIYVNIITLKNMPKTSLTVYMLIIWPL